MEKKEYTKNRKLINQINHYDRSGNKQGYVKIYPNNNIIHETVKAQIVHKLRKQGYEVFTEARIGRLRADIAAIKNGVGYIVEVLFSESEKKYMAKKPKVPKDFTMMKVYAEDFDYEEFCL